MIRRDLLTGHWKPYLERAVSLKPCYKAGINGGQVPFELVIKLLFKIVVVRLFICKMQNCNLHAVALTGGSYHLATNSCREALYCRQSNCNFLII